MTPTQREQIEQLESLGFDVKRLTFEQLVTELIHKYVEVSTALEWTEQERFERSLNSVTKKASN